MRLSVSLKLMSRLNMNRWNFESFGSGTHIVKYDNNTPHCYVYADDRWNVCIDLKNWLNHGKVPSWATSHAIAYKFWVFESRRVDAGWIDTDFSKTYIDAEAFMEMYGNNEFERI